MNRELQLLRLIRWWWIIKSKQIHILANPQPSRNQPTKSQASGDYTVIVYILIHPAANSSHTITIPVVAKEQYDKTTDVFRDGKSVGPKRITHPSCTSRKAYQPRNIIHRFMRLSSIPALVPTHPPFYLYQRPLLRSNARSTESYPPCPVECAFEGSSKRDTNRIQTWHISSGSQLP